MKFKLLSLLDTSKIERLLSVSMNDQVANLVRRICLKELATLSPHSYKNLRILRDFIWEKLNTGHWKEVSRVWRDLYSVTIVLKIVCILKAWNDEGDIDVLKDVVRLCDMGLLMGTPICDDICSLWASEIHKLISNIPNKRPKISPVNPIHNLSDYLNPIISKIPKVDILNLETFIEKYKNLEAPVIIKGLVNDWPAMDKWSIQYIKLVAGYRTVPIEIGCRYTDGNWTQKLMTINNFIDEFILNDSATEKGYLAQHNLLDQVSSLREDINTPEYCFSGEEEEDINFWFGPKGTVSPLHTDPKHNILTQVVGYKYVRLYHQSQTNYLYPYSEEDLMSNTSQIDIENPNLNEFPKFIQASGLEGILEPGDALYIPPKMWHYVKSLSLSFSVSFWFQ
uniref:JmjC domain-containing protein 5 n=1 Tax=Lepeophtheirus salmonis TaxID=72036 RepID=A0A0K2TM02_LEPSM